MKGGSIDTENVVNLCEKMKDYYYGEDSKYFREPYAELYTELEEAGIDVCQVWKTLDEVLLGIARSTTTVQSIVVKYPSGGWRDPAVTC